MGGIGSGRQKTPTNLIKYAKENDAKNLPLYFLKLSRMAMEGDREALFYLIDRHLGKAKQQTELLGGEQLGENLVAQLFMRLEAKQRELREAHAAQKQLAEGSQAEVQEA